jgi:hypothetical protein
LTVAIEWAVTGGIRLEATEIPVASLIREVFAAASAHTGVDVAPDHMGVGKPCMAESAILEKPGLADGKLRFSED